MKIRNISKRALMSILTVAICIGFVGLQQFGVAAPGYLDVPTSHWAYDYIDKATELGIISGVGDSRFDPEGQVTYAQMATMMVRLLWSGEESNYSGSEWWEPYVKAADAHKLWPSTAMSMPGGWTLNANLPVTRAHMAQILYNGVQSAGAKMPTASERTKAQNSITDFTKIATANRTAVASCYALGLLSGMDDGRFAPTSSMTRAQAAVVVCRTYALVTGDVTGSGTNTGTGTGDKPEGNSGGSDVVTVPGTSIPPVSDPVKPGGTTVVTGGKPEGAVGGKYDVNTYNVPADVNKDGYLTEAEVQAVIDRLHEEYPTGTIWGADGIGRYVSKAMGGATGCAGWAYFVSDQIFGDLPRRQIFDAYAQRIGDLTYVDTPHWTVFLGDEVIDGVHYDDSCVSTGTGANMPIQWYASGGLYSTRAVALESGRMKMYTRYPAE